MAAATTVIRVLQLIDTKELKADLTYTLTNLSDAMMQQASLFAHYGVLFARASRQVDNIKLMADTTEAAVYRKLRDEAVANGIKPVVADITLALRQHPKVIAAGKALNEAKQIEATAKIAVEAFRQKRDMLVQAGATGREEMKGEVSIRARLGHESRLDDQKEEYRQRLAQRREEEQN